MFSRVLIAFIAATVAAACIWVFLFPLRQEYLILLVAEHTTTAPIIFIGLRFLAAVIAPIPQLPVSLAAIPLFGWWQAMLYAMVGSTVGAIVNFLLARSFREPLVAQVAPLQKIKQWERRLTETQEFWAFVAVRFLTELMTDVVSYAAGLTRIKLWHYTMATVLGDLPWKLLVFYVGGKSGQYGGPVGIVGFLLILLLGIAIFRRSRLYRNLEGAD